MPPTGSIEGRLQLGLALSLALLIGGAWWLGHLALHRTAEAYVLSRLEHDAEALLGVLELSPEGGLHLGRRGMAPVYRQPYSGHYYLVLVDGERSIHSRSLWDQGLEVRQLPPGQTAHWRSAGPLGQDLLVWAEGFARHGHDLTLAVAEDLSTLEDPLQFFEHLFALMAILGLVTMLLIQRWILRQAFARLRPVLGDIEALEGGRATALREAVPAEILPLVAKINGLLRVYAKRLERSRNAAGNLAHALKGPLSLMVQELGGGADGLDPAARARLSDQLGQVRRLLERELKRARLAGEGTPGIGFDPHAELPVLERLLRGMYPEKRLQLECPGAPGGVTPMDREDMLELAGTLLDNACKWARTQVRCRCALDGQGLRLLVEDDGPGCPESELASIAERGTRLDEGVQGHGLGLSIAREIVELYGGHLELGRSAALGGFRAEVRLPLRRGAGSP